MSELVEIKVDVHEQDSEVFDRISGRSLGACQLTNLKTGDVVLRYNFYTVGLEIKRGSDFDNALREDRLHDQLCRLTQAFDFPVLVIEDWHPYKADGDEEEDMKEKVRLHEMTVRTLNRRIATYETPHLEATVDLIAEMVRDLKMKKLNVLRRPVIVEDDLDPAIKILCGFPQVSKSRAEELLIKYKSAKNAIEHMDEWPEMKIGLTKDRVRTIRFAWEE